MVFYLQKFVRTKIRQQLGSNFLFLILLLPKCDYITFGYVLSQIRLSVVCVSVVCL